MTLFLSLLPLYIFGNLHCLGMCGPLVMLLGQHSYRLYYFVGRLVSYSSAGFFAGWLGAVLHLSFKKIFLSEIMSCFVGIAMIAWGICTMGKMQIMKQQKKKSLFLVSVQRSFSSLILKNTIVSTFLFGFLTVALPCGQTILVFSACAIVGDPWIGLANGFALAFFTSPALALAMQAFSWCKKAKQYDRIIIGGCSIVVGMIACCRGMAEIGWISHWVINPESAHGLHVVIF